jgi:hypothetical protein
MNTVGVCALLGVMAAAEVAPEKQTMALTLLVPEPAPVPDLVAFLRKRASELWDLDPAASVAFDVMVARPENGRLLLTIVERNQELARRELAMDADPGATKLTAWLLVKATIQRALKQERPAPPLPEPVVTEVPVAPEPTSSRWGLGGLVSASLGPVELARFGPSLVAWINPRHRLVMSLEIGYRVSPTAGVSGGGDLTVHFVPMTASLGWQLNDLWSVAGYATTDVKIPVSNESSAIAAGLDLGAYLQLHVPTGERWRLLLRAFAGGRASRLRYLVDGGSITESAWVGGAAVGGLWQ